jgi:hypothetical protein
MTTLKTVALAAALVASPALAFAGCNYGKIEQVQSCASGSTWDVATQSCVPIASS